MHNRDSFGLDAGNYRQYRPTYPAELFEWLASQAPGRRRALDCATGSGQAAVDLADWFQAVDAIDSSAEQINAATAHQRVRYSVSPAEALPFDDGQFDVITVAQGAHWFELDAFYAEASRVARIGGLIAVWGYSYCAVSPQIDDLVERCLLGAIEPYWAEGNRVITDRYRGIPFPFQELRWPEFSVKHSWTRETYIRYLATWSAVRKYTQANGGDILGTLEAQLSPHWPDGQMLGVQFQFVGRAGRVDSN